MIFGICFFIIGIVFMTISPIDLKDKFGPSILFVIFGVFSWSKGFAPILKITLDEIKVTLYQYDSLFVKRQYFSFDKISSVFIQHFPNSRSRIVIRGPNKYLVFAELFPNDEKDYILKVLKHYCHNKKDDRYFSDDDLSEHLID